MTSYIVKHWIGNEFDKVVKDITGGDKDEQKQDNGMSGEEIVNEENRLATLEQERKARQAKVEKEREDARQKIREKYNLKKKDDPPTTSKHHHGKVESPPTRIDSANVKPETTKATEPQGFDPMKMTTDAFNSFKRKFGWK